MNWKTTICLVAGLLSANAIKAATLEIAEENETIVARLIDGDTITPVAVNLDDSPKDAWTVELLGGYSFAESLRAEEFTFGEPEDATKHNAIFFSLGDGNRFLLWNSDIKNVQTFSSLATDPNSAFIPGDALDPNQGTLNLLLVDREVETTPDGGSTFALAGLGVLAVGALRSKFKS
jgi:hypothetical protein